METRFFENERKLKTNIPATILTIISLVLTVCSSLDEFTYYTYADGGSWELGFSLGNNLIDIIFSLLSYTITVAPVILFTIYILKFYKQFRANGLIPISLGLIAFGPIFYLIRSLIMSRVFEYGYSIAPIDLFVDFIVVVSFALAAISSLKGFPKKIYIIIAVACGVFSVLVSLIQFMNHFVHYIEEELYLYAFTWPLTIIGNACLYMAFLFLSLKHKMPAAIQSGQNTAQMSPEQALRVLKDKFDVGVLSEEEYQAQRAEIIRKL